MFPSSLHNGYEDSPFPLPLQRIFLTRPGIACTHHDQQLSALPPPASGPRQDEPKVLHSTYDGRQIRHLRWEAESAAAGTCISSGEVWSASGSVGRSVGPLRTAEKLMWRDDNGAGKPDSVLVVVEQLNWTSIRSVASHVSEDSGRVIQMACLVAGVRLANSASVVDVLMMSFCLPLLAYKQPPKATAGAWRL